MEKHAIIGATLGLMGKLALPAALGFGAYGYGKEKLFDAPRREAHEKQENDDKYFARWAQNDKNYYEAAERVRQSGALPAGSTADQYGAEYKKKPFISSEPLADKLYPVREKKAFDLSEYAPGIREGLSAVGDKLRNFNPQLTEGVSRWWDQLKTNMGKAWKPIQRRVDEKGVVKGLWTIGEKPKEVRYVTSPEGMAKEWDEAKARST